MVSRMEFREKYCPETFRKGERCNEKQQVVVGGAVCFHLRDDPRGPRGHGLEYHRLNNHRDEWRKWRICLTQVACASEARWGGPPGPRTAPWPAGRQADEGVRRGPGGPP